MRKKDIEKELGNISPEKIFKYLSEKSFGPKRYTHKNGIRIKTFVKVQFGTKIEIICCRRDFKGEAILA